MKIEIDIDAAIQRSDEKLRRDQERLLLREQRQVEQLSIRREAELRRNRDHVREFAPRLQAILNEEEPPYLVGRWLLFDYWTAEQGLVLLSGLEPEQRNDIVLTVADMDTRHDDHLRDEFVRISAIRTLRGLKLWENYSSLVPEWRSIRAQLVAEFSTHVRELTLVWESGDHPEKASPQYFIDWAARKNIHVPWKEYAIEKGLLFDDRPAKSTPPTPEIGEGERATMLKQIASLALVLAERSGKYKRGDKPNGSALAQAIDELVSALPDANRHGLSSSSIRENIKMGVDLLAK